MDLIDISKSYEDVTKGLPSYLRGVQRAGQFPQGVRNTGAMGNRIAANSYGRGAGKRLRASGRATTPEGFMQNAEGFATMAARGREARSMSRVLGG
jgi:hypothetical protein